MLVTMRRCPWCTSPSVVLVDAELELHGLAVEDGLLPGGGDEGDDRVRAVLEPRAGAEPVEVRRDEQEHAAPRIATTTMSSTRVKPRDRGRGGDARWARWRRMEAGSGWLLLFRLGPEDVVLRALLAVLAVR